MATLATLQADLTLWRAARDAILTGAQSYVGPGGRSVTRTDMKVIQTAIKELEARIECLTRVAAGNTAGFKLSPIFINRR